MACSVVVLKEVPLFSLLDDEELAVLAGQVELRKFTPRQRIFRIGDPSERAFIMVSGSVEVTTIDEDNQVVLLDMPSHGDVFGFASMLAQTPHQTEATAVEETECIEVDLHDITVLLRKKPDAGLDLMTVMGKQFHAAERLVRLRAARNPNDVIEEAETLGERIADVVASFGGSWTFIMAFAVVLASAEPDFAAEIVVRGSVENSGQLCCAIERVYVQRGVYEAFADRVVERMKALKMNTDDIREGELGPIIFARQAEILREQLADATAKGARMLTGGRIVEHGGGLWCEPTVLVDVTQDMAVMRDETFGPIVPIIAFDTEEEAVRLANDTEFGLSAAVIGEEAKAIEIGGRINAGGLWINDFDTMGGVGARAEKTAFGCSGLGGTRYGLGGFRRFLRKKAIVIRSVAA